MADETKDASTRPPRRKVQALTVVPDAPPRTPAPPDAAAVQTVVPSGPPKTPEEKRALARKLAGMAPEMTAAEAAAPAPGRVVPIHARPEDSPEWWRNHVGALLLVSEGQGAPTEIRLEGVSPNGDYLRCRPTGGVSFMWRPRTVVRLLDIVAYPEDIAAYEQAWRKLYGQDPEAVDQKIKDAVHAALIEYGIVQP